MSCLCGIYYTNIDLCKTDQLFLLIYNCLFVLYIPVYVICDNDPQ